MNGLPPVSRVDDARRQVERGQQREGLRVHQHEARVLDADADGDDPPGAVERDRRALGPQERGGALHRAPERARTGVGVGLVGVVVDVAAPVRRHERVARHGGRLHGLGLVRRTDERRDAAGLGAFRDRHGGDGGERRGREDEGSRERYDARRQEPAAQSPEHPPLG